MLRRLLPALLLVACTEPIEPPGARGHTLPRHIKTPSYEKRNIPTTPMTTHHVIELDDGCGNHCDFRQRSQSTLTLHLQDNGVARAEDIGELVEEIESSVANSEARTTWKRTWTGSWSEGEDTLEVVLQPAEIGCTRTPETGATTNDCTERREIRLRCQLVQLSLVRPRNTGTRAWACRARGLRKTTAISPMPWIFGISDPVVVLDGGNSHAPTRRYALSKPRPKQ